MMILKDGLVIVEDSQMGHGADLVAVGSACVVNVVHESCKQD